MAIWLRKYWPLLVIILVFFFFRLPALDQIYHQDEYRWAMQADPNIDDASPHPPFGKQFLRLVGTIFGFDYLRIGPLFFGFLGLILLYFTIEKLSGNKATALIAAGLYSTNIYSVIANLQIDIDGAILPFFVLLGYYSYLNLKDNSKSRVWWLIFILAMIGGFMTKISFLLFIVALFVDYGYDFYISNNLRIGDIIKKYYKSLSLALILVAGFSFVYIKFQSNTIEYAGHFNSLNFASRAYFELAFKILKSFVWLSPILLLPVLSGIFNKEIFKRNKFWYIYLAVNLIFYTILFDFARLTVERYFMFWIMPAVIISSDWLEKSVRYLFGAPKRYLTLFILPIIVFICLTILAGYLHPVVLPLDPKIGYVNHIKSFDFNFLIPMTGGSGPVGFYVSALFVLWIWLVSLFVLLASYFKKYKEILIIVFVVFGVGYNLILLEEYLSGSFYGSVPKISKEAVDYALGDPKINKVITYYDIGAYNLKMNGKYLSRFYTAPSRDYTEKLSAYRGYYMIVDFPAIDKKGRYWPYLEKCEEVKKFSDKKINAYVLNCR